MGIVTRWVDGRVKLALDKLIDNDINLLAPVVVDEHWRASRNKVLYEGTTSDIIRFYKTRFPKAYEWGELNNFYRVEHGNLPVLHYPVARLITKTMVSLLFGDTPDIKLLKDGKLLEDQSQIEDLEKATDIGALLQKCAEYESYSGYTALKPIIDPEVSELPFFVPYDGLDIEFVRKYDKVTEVIFKDIYKKESETAYYYLYTVCGRGFIEYHLYRPTKKKDKNNELPLTTLEETKNLPQRIDFYYKGQPYKKLMCVWKENLPGGKSDYLEIEDDQVAIDEIYSNMINFIRKSSIKTYRPENTLSIDERTGRPIPSSEYDTSDIILHDNNPEGTKQEIKRDQIEIMNVVDGYKNAFNHLVCSAIRSAGLSVSSFGYDDASANSSGEALTIKERETLRTRSQKIKLWIPCIKDMFELLIDLADCKFQDGIGYINDHEDRDISVVFGEYSHPTFDEKVTSISNALNNNLIDLDSALHMLWTDKTDDEIELMKIQIEGQLLDEEELVDKELRDDETKKEED